MSDTKQLNIISLNTRGLASSSKRSKVFIWLQKQKADIILLQETHCTKGKLKGFKNSWHGLSFYGLTNSPHSRGVGILFGNKLNVNVIDHHDAGDGRRLLVNIEIESKMYTLVTVYAPNVENERHAFFNDLTVWVQTHACNTNDIILGGDFNCCLEDLDRNSKTHLKDKSCISMRKMCVYFKCL